jgi:hypothetical protein
VQSLYTIQFDESVHEKYRQMTLRGQYSFTLFTLDDKYTTISVEKTGEPGMAWADIVAQLPEKECRFVAFVFKYKTPGGESDRIKTGLLRWYEISNHCPTPVSGNLCSRLTGLGVPLELH